MKMNDDWWRSIIDDKSDKFIADVELLSAGGASVKHDKSSEQFNGLTLAAVVSGDERLDGVSRRGVQLVGHQSLVHGDATLDRPHVLTLSSCPQNTFHTRHVATTNWRHVTVRHTAQHCTTSPEWQLTEQSSRV